MSRPIYLDYASSVPMRPSCKKEIDLFLDQHFFADPARVHGPGTEMRYLIESYRQCVANLAGVDSFQITFTSSGTEANVTAIFSNLVENPGTTVLSTSVEHSSVYKACDSLCPIFGAKHFRINVNSKGCIDLNHLYDLINKNNDVSLIICQYANQETGTLQPIKAVIEIARERKIPVLVDGCSAFGQVQINLKDLGADYFSLSSHKMGGPPGIGALIISPKVRIKSIFPGSQERGRRGGFENSIAIAGFGAVCKELYEGAIDRDFAKNQMLSQLALKELSAISDVHIYGDLDNKLPHIICVGIDNLKGEAIVMYLDQRNIFIHSGSACGGESLEPSKVLSAMGLSDDTSIRISFGWETTKDDIIMSVSQIADAIKYFKKEPS
jgi:cysteine desulfurase